MNRPLTFPRHGLRTAAAALCAVVLRFHGGAASAGRPLQTEDAGVLERGECELESAAERTSSTLWSVAAERTGLGRWDAMAEVFGDDRTDPWINGGLRFAAIAGRLFLDGSYGVQLGSGRARLARLGMKLAF